MTSKKLKWIGALACAPLAIPLGSFAEEGVRATLGISNRLESVNESGYTRPQKEGERFVTGLDFGLTSENSYQRLGIFANTNLAYNTNTQVNDQFETEDPFLRFTYGLESRQSALDFSASYRRTDVDRANFFDEFETDDVETGAGDRTTVTFATGLVLGRDAPVTLSLDHLYARNTYSGQTDGDTSDSTRNRLGANLAMRVSPVATVNLFGNWSETDRDDPDASDQTTQSVGIGTTYAVSEILTLSANVSYDEATSSNANTEDSKGLGFAFGLDRELPNGSVGLDLTRSETINGARDQMSIARAMVLPRGSLRYSIGLTRTDNTDVRPLANVAYSHDLTPTSQFNVSLNQSSYIDDDDDETVRTRLSLGYSYEINEISSLSAGADFASQNALEEDGVDRSSISANLTYRREVGADWDMVTGYRYTASRRDNEQNRNSSTLFVGLEKNFDWRP